MKIEFGQICSVSEMESETVSGKNENVPVCGGKRKSDSSLLDTFNEALSNIISHNKKSSVENSETDVVDTAEDNKLTKSGILFPDNELKTVAAAAADVSEISENRNRGICDEEKQRKERTFDSYQEWVDGSRKCCYPLSLREAQSHSSGWAMKYTNNHNKFVLKKTCVGVLLCSEDCIDSDGNKVFLRPAISDKVRERQLGQPCPNPDCPNGRIVHRKCCGNNGYPVTHFWVHHMDYIHFEAKGSHDHPKPEAKRSSLRRRENNTKYEYNDREAMCPVYFHSHGKEPLTHPRYSIVEQSHPITLHNDYVLSCDVAEGNEHVSFATPRMRQLAQRAIGRYQADMRHTARCYVLCRTLPNYVNGFDLLESRLVSFDTQECPLLLVTMYRCGSVDGVIEHIRHLASMCSPIGQKICVPKWHCLVHDFSEQLLSLVVESIVNLMVDLQMQTLLKEFQYKSVSSLYKMLRQKMLGTMKTFEEHFDVCKYELFLRLRDPIKMASLQQLFACLQSQRCTTDEFLEIDLMLKDGVYGAHAQHFWQFWGNEVIAPAVFPIANTTFATVLHDHQFCTKHETRLRSTIQDILVSLVKWVEKRGVLYFQQNAFCRQIPVQHRNFVSTFGETRYNTLRPLLISYGTRYRK